LRPFDAPTARDLAAEPWVVETDVELTQLVGGKTTQRCLQILQQKLPAEDFERLRCDVRVQHFRPGDAVPRTQWHCDYMKEVAGIRTPDPVRDPQVKHCMLISGEPRTEFLTMPCEVAVVTDFNHALAKIAAYTSHVGAVAKIPANTLVQFDAEAVHRGTVYRGAENTVRYFFRASLFPKGDLYDGQYTNQVSMKVRK